MADRKPRCSVTSRSLDEPVAGTASTVTRWLLVEHPAAWSTGALDSRGIAADVAEHLKALWARHRIRVVLVRRRFHEAGGGLRSFAAWTGRSGPSGPWIERTRVQDVRELLDVDFSPLARGRSVGFDRRRDPVFIVCTHGSHDTCCGLYGRPVADAMAEWWPTETWECSHIGGDRFAGNVVCFPLGDYFGRLDREVAPVVIASYLDGSIDLAHYRGRTCYPFAVQAAEVWARRDLGLDGLDQVRPLDWGDHVVRFEIEGGPVVAVRVVASPSERARFLTCAEVAMVQPPTFAFSWEN
ncbi:MAG: sucrase ferredoxin [Acidimicrobiales bacterium]